ncbi:hypothetical protein M427DRAFT_157922 [Gonapodya prolifera JEL478]|uniref:SH3 domain-containing protein n=1 Tax=Gonapodya prolifera (strain JEL478) TaxID=1344416 RepID=A0A139A5E2_GONPJ|nr:hypothetical protein M427DRAFT_157922 [Gonapodya prolifera JEL478]|eukprot:KXS11685.1 hypothetical protein M427DRAFT_157922 [Gonapodya prolifera JEL478]
MNTPNAHVRHRTTKSGHAIPTSAIRFLPILLLPILIASPPAYGQSCCSHQASGSSIIVPGQICGCAFTWAGTFSLTQPKSNVAVSPANACADGYSVCSYSDVVALLPSASSCAGVVGSYVAKFSHCIDITSDGTQCTYGSLPHSECTPSGTLCSEPFCCGSGCSPGTCSDLVWAGQTTKFGGPTTDGCGSFQGNRATGVLCCGSGTSTPPPPPSVPPPSLPSATSPPTLPSPLPPVTSAGAPATSAGAPAPSSALSSSPLSASAPSSSPISTATATVVLSGTTPPSSNPSTTTLSGGNITSTYNNALLPTAANFANSGSSGSSVVPAVIGVAAGAGAVILLGGAYWAGKRSAKNKAARPQPLPSDDPDMPPPFSGTRLFGKKTDSIQTAYLDVRGPQFPPPVASAPISRFNLGSGAVPLSSSSSSQWIHMTESGGSSTQALKSMRNGTVGSSLGSVAPDVHGPIQPRTVSLLMLPSANLRSLSSSSTGSGLTERPHWLFAALADRAVRNGAQPGGAVSYSGHAATVTEAYTATAEDEISVVPGQTVLLSTLYADGWARGTCAETSLEGVLPLAVLDIPEPSSLAYLDADKSLSALPSVVYQLESANASATTGVSTSHHY